MSSFWLDKDKIRAEVIPVAIASGVFGTEEMSFLCIPNTIIYTGTCGFLAGGMFALLGRGPVLRSAMWTSGVLSLYVSSSISTLILYFEVLHV